MQEKLEDAHKFKLWKKNLEANQLKINKIEEIYSRIHNNEVLFSLLLLDAETPEGGKIPPICFLKGEVVSILVCLIDIETKEKYLLLVKQRRIVEGGFTYEHPAGMVDNIKTPLKIAIQEVREETGIEVAENQLVNVTKKRLFPSTGTSDEAMYFYYCEIELSKTEIDTFNNKDMGTEHDYERITTHVFPFLEAHQLITNTNGVLLNYMYLADVKDWNLLQKLEN